MSARITSAMCFAVVSILLYDVGDPNVDEGNSTFICYLSDGANLFRDVNITVTVMPISGEFIMPFFKIDCFYEPITFSLLLG